MTLAILTALFFGLNTLPVKRLAERGWNESSIAWGNFAVGAVPLLVVAFFFGSWEFRPGFWPNFAAGLSGNFLAFTMYYRALRKSDISIVMPLVSLSPLFMIVTSRVMLGESPNAAGYFGIGLIVLGAYLLGLSKDRSTILGPFRAIARDPGAQLALGVSFIWSITSNLDKRCVLLSDPFSYLAVSGLGVTVLYAPIVWTRDRFRQVRNSDHNVWALGALHAAMVVCQMQALTLLPASYVIATKRSGLLVGVMIGHFRGEPGIRLRLPAAIFMAAGVAILLLGA